MADTGLGEAFPPAQDLAPNSAYDVFGFELEGVRYYQVNVQGQVRFVVGVIGETAWALPAGSDAKRVILPGAPGSSDGEVLYQAADIVIRRRQSSEGDAWSVDLPADR